MLNRLSFLPHVVAGFGLSICMGLLNAQAITIDEFDGTQNVVSSIASTNNSSGLNTTTALGGVRTVQVIANSGASNFETIKASVFAGRFIHSQDSSVTGSTQIVWDGDTTPTVNGAGLGAVNLAQDGATAFRLKVLSFDFAGGQPLVITVTAFDANDATGNTFSRGTITLSQQVNTLKLRSTILLDDDRRAKWSGKLLSYWSCTHPHQRCKSRC